MFDAMNTKGKENVDVQKLNFFFGNPDFQDISVSQNKGSKSMTCWVRLS